MSRVGIAFPSCGIVFLLSAVALAQSTERRAALEDRLSGIFSFGPDRRVDSGSGSDEGNGGASPIGQDVRASQEGGAAPQNETSIAVNLLDPLNLVGGWNDYRFGDAKAGCAYSLDGGATWADAGVMNEPGFSTQGDPSIAFDGDGNAYYAFISFNRNDEKNGIFVARSTDGGAHWPEVRGVIVHNTNGQPFEDKENIWCDTTGGSRDGNVYVSWTRFGNADIVLARSTDRGVTWSSPVSVSDFSGNQGSVPRVGPDGTIYVAWDNGDIRFDRSTNGGVSFGADKTAATVIGNIGNIGSFRANSFPAMDVDLSSGSTRGNIYIVWADLRNGDADVFFVRSTNGGTSFSSPRRINDDPVGNDKDQFFPWIAVDRTTGEITVMFYDRRDDPANHKIHTYIARSADGGTTWDSNRRVSSMNWDPNNDGFGGTFIGDYNGHCADGGRSHPLWTDTRLGNADAWTATFDTRPPAILSIDPPAGTILGGTTVTVIGERLYQGFTVLFDGVAGTGAVYTNDGQVSIKTPAHVSDGGLVDVVVNNGFGSTTATDGFAYLGLKMAGTTSIGDTVTFTTSGTPGSDYVTLIDRSLGSGTKYGIVWNLRLGAKHRTIHDSLGFGDPPTDGTGHGVDAFKIPNKTRLIGLTAYVQSAVDVNGSSAGGLYLSNIVSFGILP